MGGAKKALVLEGSNAFMFFPRWAAQGGTPIGGFTMLLFCEDPLLHVWAGGGVLVFWCFIWGFFFILLEAFYHLILRDEESENVLDVVFTYEMFSLLLLLLTTYLPTSF